MWFDEVKRSLLKTGGFINIGNYKIRDKDDLHYDIVRRCNMTLFLTMLFANVDLTTPKFSNVESSHFFDYIVPLL